ncbi:MAG: VWA domain-containing protein, partial [Planctomycetes bacterium]|nr:VWA domain-containing protein [Planctomycetota bacterium]
MQPERILNVTTNPAWRPLTNADLPGYVVLAACAAVLVGLTLWTYLGSAQTTPRRLFTLIFLRLLALFVTLLTALRPAISVTEQPRLKSSLIVMLDASESMTVTDEYDKLSRYEVLRRVMEKSEPLLKRLEAEQDVALQLYFFSTDFNPRTDQYQPQNEEKKSVSIGDWIKARKPDGKRTDFGQMLAELMKVNSGKMDPIRGMIIISDGGNNVTSPDAFKQASRWQGIGCPIYPFIVGRTDTK